MFSIYYFFCPAHKFYLSYNYKNYPYLCINNNKPKKNKKLWKCAQIAKNAIRLCYIQALRLYAVTNAPFVSNALKKCSASARIARANSCADRVEKQFSVFSDAVCSDAVCKMRVPIPLKNACTYPVKKSV